MNLLENAFFIQLLGVIAFMLGVSSVAHRNDKTLKVLFTAQAATLAVHFMLLGAWSAAAVACLASLRNFISLKWQMRQLAWIFIILYCALGSYYGQTWVDILPVCASCMGTYGIFYHTGIKMRACLFVGAFLWCVHNVYVGSIAPAFMEAFMCLVNLRTIYKLSTAEKAGA